uniref:Uncharacterized protein n=1 Tax=Chromera velia CCMP2878 TaxID=1169474 RepID=A0A0G4EZ04_9ALVE|eukprot:Cvel_14211.t1-p1 / transcript=Cvel_14211.t1 / gene=Cvel_14211 / organism=Chromera_velia_CCMP2878 / gene_product=hypothetical protein / transcript_product=hypothetical protein / location=Cvel_scaffold1002:23966-25216(-) / protein_length=417 / sequence_SO=supercontig / SO=protein_coding / is_pseudo=false
MAGMEVVIALLDCPAGLNPPSDLFEKAFGGSGWFGERGTEVVESLVDRLLSKGLRPSDKFFERPCGELVRDWCQKADEGVIEMWEKRVERIFRKIGRTFPSLQPSGESVVEGVRCVSACWVRCVHSLPLGAPWSPLKVMKMLKERFEEYEKAGESSTFETEEKRQERLDIRFHCPVEFFRLCSLLVCEGCGESETGKGGGMNFVEALGLCSEAARKETGECLGDLVSGFIDAYTEFHVAQGGPLVVLERGEAKALSLQSDSFCVEEEETEDFCLFQAVLFGMQRLALRIYAEFGVSGGLTWNMSQCLEVGGGTGSVCLGLDLQGGVTDRGGEWEGQKRLLRRAALVSEGVEWDDCLCVRCCACGADCEDCLAETEEERAERLEMNRLREETEVCKKRTGIPCGIPSEGRPRSRSCMF